MIPVQNKTKYLHFFILMFYALPCRAVDKGTYPLEEALSALMFATRANINLVTEKGEGGKEDDLAKSQQDAVLQCYLSQVELITDSIKIRKIKDLFKLDVDVSSRAEADIKYKLLQLMHQLVEPTLQNPLSKSPLSIDDSTSLAVPVKFISQALDMVQNYRKQIVSINKKR